MERFKIVPFTLLLFVVYCQSSKIGQHDLVSTTIQSLASLPTDGKQISDDQLNLVRIFFEEEFSKYPEYKLIERTELEKVLGEMQFQQSGLVNTSQITKIGNLSGADILLSTSVNQVDGQYIVQCKLIDLQGNIKGTATGRSSNMQKIDGAVKGCARRLTGRM